MPPFQENLPLPTDGQPVAAGTLVPSLRVLNDNVRFLKAIIDDEARGETVFARDVTVEPDALLWQPVYYNSQTQRFERALANTAVDPTTGALLTTDSSRPWGVIAEKTNATKAKLLLQGYYPADLANAVDGTVTAGMYYLSGTTPGKLVKQRPPGVSVMVLMTDGNGMIYVNPAFRDSFDDHKHYQFALVCAPAGDYTPGSPTANITAQDVELEGWLRADHSSFQGKAPQNATFGYNLAASALRHVFPPIPLQSVYLEWNKALDSTVGGTGVPLGSSGLCVINGDGIWWLSNCEDDVPWLSDSYYVAGERQDPDSEESDSPNVAECPRNLFMEMKLWFTRMTFKTSATVVTSLRAKTDSRLSVTCYPAGGDGSTGDLELDLDLEFVVGNDNELGAVVLKALDGNSFKRGVVTEGLKAGTSNVSVVGTIQRRQTPGDDDTPLIHQGIVEISASLDVNGREVPLDQVRLLGATEEFYQNVTALGLATGVKSGFQGKVRIPAVDLPTGTVAKLVFWVLGRTAGTLPALQLAYRVLPAATTTPTTLPTTDTSLAALGGETVAANQYVLAKSGEIEIAAGDVLQFTLFRNTSVVDGYAGQVQILDVRAKLVTP